MHNTWTGRKPWWISAAVLVLLGLVFLSVYLWSPAQQKSARPNQDWSRGLRLSSDGAGTIALAVDPESGYVLAIWSEGEPGEEQFWTRLINSQGEVVRCAALPLPGQVRAPRLAYAGSGVFHLVWSSREAGAADWTLWYGQIETGSSSLLQEPRRLSPTGVNVAAYDLAANPAGQALVVWSVDPVGEIRGIGFGPQGISATPPVAFTSSGEHPSAWLTESGQALVVWRSGLDLLFANPSFMQLESFQLTRVVDLTASGGLGLTGNVFYGPEMGYADGWVYVLWSILSISDVETGTATTDYAAFRADKPRQVQSVRVTVLASEKQPQVPYQGAFKLEDAGLPLDFSSATRKYGTEQVVGTEKHIPWVDIVGGVSDFNLRPVAMTGTAKGLAVALATTQEARVDSSQEATILFFEAGEFQAYSIAGRTGNLSDGAVVAVDPLGNLYAAWREGAAQNEVYYATTLASAQPYLNRTTRNDLVSVSATIGLEIATSLLLLPVVGFFWVLPGFLLIGAYKVFRERDTLRAPRAWNALLLAIGLFYGMKFISLPSLLTYVPFSAWLSVPEGLAGYLRVFIPLLFVGVGVWAAKHSLQRSESSPLVFYSTYVLVESSLTMMVYGVNFLGAF